MSSAHIPSDVEAWRAAFDASRDQTVAGALGIQFVDVADDYLVLEMPITDASRQPMGLLHGGVSMVLAETAASFHACRGVDLGQVAPVGIEINGSHLASADRGVVRCTARVLRRSRSLIVHECDVRHVETNKQLCAARVTNFYRPIGQQRG
jgi:uncharacterized protein (TIGR00369 family)